MVRPSSPFSSTFAAVTEFEAGTNDDLPPGPDPHRPLQDLAAEILSAYEADIGFGAG